MHIRRHVDISFKSFLKRTISAQLHLLGLILAIIGLIVLLDFASDKVDHVHFWACLIFGATGILIFAASTVYHFLSDGYRISPALDHWLEQLDHFAIYLFIAGTYTPVLLNAVRGPWQIALLIGIWALALIGIVYTNFKAQLPRWSQHRFVYTGLFVLMGWVLAIRLREVIQRMSSTGLILLVAGGLSYTIGAVIYATKRPRLYVDIFGFHELWHIMVLFGFGFHYFMILNFYLN